MDKFTMIIRGRHEKALASLLENEDFRFYMAELLGYCKTFENAFSEKGNVAAFNNGLQSAGQKIYNDIMAVNPQAYIKMCAEEKELMSLRNQIGDRNADTTKAKF